jgi:hypothetical protein
MSILIYSFSELHFNPTGSTLKGMTDRETKVTVNYFKLRTFTFVQRLFTTSLFVMLLTYSNPVLSQTGPHVHSLLQYNQNADLLL